MTTLILSQPVQSMGKDVTEITFREPKGKDIAHCGLPFKMLQSDDGGEDGIVPLSGSVTKYIARLTGLTAGAVGDLSAHDFMEALQIVLGFFGPKVAGSTPPTSSISTTTSPASGT